MRYTKKTTKSGKIFGFFHGRVKDAREALKNRVLVNREEIIQKVKVYEKRFMFPDERKSGKHEPLFIYMKKNLNGTGKLQ